MPYEAVFIDTTISAMGTRLRSYGNTCIIAKDGYATETFSAPGVAGAHTFSMSQQFTDVKSVQIGDVTYTEDSAHSYPSTPDVGKYNYSADDQVIVCNIADGDKNKIPTIETYCYNKYLYFERLSDVADQFGSSTDIYKAATNFFAQQTRELWIIRAKIIDVANEAAADIDDVTMTLAHYPPCGEVTPTVTGDGSSATVVWNPQADYAHLPSSGSGEAWINPITGFVGIDSDMISGTGAGLKVSYSYIDWDSIIKVLSNEDNQIVAIADTPLSNEHLGDLDKLIGFCDDQERIMAIQTKATDTPAQIVTTSGYLTPSPNVTIFATKQNEDDIAAAVAGKISTLQPWMNLMWKRVYGLSTTEFHTRSEVEQDLEPNKINAIIKKIDTTVLSDGLTTQGGDYKYIDITRTKYYLVNMIKDRLTTLLMNERLPYEQKSLGVIKSVIESACEQAVRDGALRSPWVDQYGEVQQGYIVEMPVFDNIPTSDRANRVLRNVYVTAYLAGHIQKLMLNLELKV